MKGDLQLLVDARAETTVAPICRSSMRRFRRTNSGDSDALSDLRTDHAHLIGRNG
jgi:hypothetical protein